MTDDLDLAVLGRRIRHARRERGMTLGALARAVDRAPSLLSQIENGQREPKLALLRAIATALDAELGTLIDPEAPSHRDELEIALLRSQRGALYRELGLPVLRAGAGMPTEVLEALVGMHRELGRRARLAAATPEAARRANAELRGRMRARDNYFADIEATAQAISDAVGHVRGPLTERGLDALAAHLGFTLVRTSGLPRSTRCVTDLRHHRVYLPGSVDGPAPRSLALRALAGVVLGHSQPVDYPDFLRQRVEANYLAAALLMPERACVADLTTAKEARDIAIEDLRDTFAVSYETAAHRFTNLATHHLGLPVHFMRVGEDGTIYKAYENDEVQFPTDVTGAIEGQVVCRQWASRAVFRNPNRFASHYQYTDMGRGTYWCTTHVERSSGGDFAIDVGTPYASVKWFRGRETTVRARSGCPDPSCCRRPPADLAARWADWARPSARMHSHLLAALPAGTFPGVDDTEVYAFLEAQGSEQADA